MCSPDGFGRRKSKIQIIIRAVALKVWSSRCTLDRDVAVLSYGSEEQNHESCGTLDIVHFGVSYKAQPKMATIFWRCLPEHVAAF